VSCLSLLSPPHIHSKLWVPSCAGSRSPSRSPEREPYRRPRDDRPAEDGGSDQEEEEEEDPEAAAMAAMGFGGFGTTKVRLPFFPTISFGN
jgi:hypothetical protein